MKRLIGIIALVGVLIAGGAIIVPHLLGSGSGPHRYLSGIDVRDMVRDGEGTLWLATQKGLYRLPPEGRPSPVTGDEALRLPMSSIAMEKSGRIWMGTDEGLVTRTPEGVERIATVIVSSRPQCGGASRTEYAIGRVLTLEASDKWLIVGTATSVAALDLATGTWTVERNVFVWVCFLGGVFGDRRPVSQCREIVVDADGRIWVLLEDALTVFRPGPRMSLGTGYSVFEEGAGVVSVRLNRFLKQLPDNWRTEQVEHETPPAIATDDTGRLVILTSDGHLLRPPTIPRGNPKAVIIDDFPEVAYARWIADLPQTPVSFSYSAGRLAVAAPCSEGSGSALHVGGTGAETVTQFPLEDAQPHRICPDPTGVSWWIATSDGLVHLP